MLLMLLEGAHAGAISFRDAMDATSMTTGAKVVVEAVAKDFLNSEPCWYAHTSMQLQGYLQVHTSAQKGHRSYRYF